MSLMQRWVACDVFKRWRVALSAVLGCVRGRQWVAGG